MLSLVSKEQLKKTATGKAGLLAAAVHVADVPAERVAKSV